MRTIKLEYARVLAKSMYKRLKVSVRYAWPAHVCAHTIKLAMNTTLAQHACSIANSAIYNSCVQ